LSYVAFARSKVCIKGVSRVGGGEAEVNCLSIGDAMAERVSVGALLRSYNVIEAVQETTVMVGLGGGRFFTKKIPPARKEKDKVSWPAKKIRNLVWIVKGQQR